MTTLQKNALGRVPLPSADVEDHYETYRAGFGSSPAASIVRRLCESHERLRMELEGSAVLHDDSAKSLRQAADDAAESQARFLTLRKQLEHAVEVGLTHAAKLAAWRDGLLRIFARAPDWSGECVQANVADLLGMTVRDVQAEIDREAIA